MSDTIEVTDGKIWVSVKRKIPVEPFGGSVEFGAGMQVETLEHPVKGDFDVEFDLVRGAVADQMKAFQSYHVKHAVKELEGFPSDFTEGLIKELFKKYPHLTKESDNASS